MSLKQLSKTRWKLETDRVTLYPFGLFFILSAVLGVIFTGIMLVYVMYSNPTSSESISLFIFLLLITVLIWGSGNTYIEFDNRRGVMRKKLMGFIPVSTLPFNRLQGITPVTNVGGGYNYRMFKKDDRFGKGVTVSSGYAKNNDPNAIAFVEEAVPVIHAYLDQHDVLSDRTAPEPIKAYKYFVEKDGVFFIKTKPVAAVLFGLFFIGVAYWLFNTPTVSAITTTIMMLFMLAMGLVFINAAFTKFSLDPLQQIIRRKGLAGFLNKQYHFNEYAGIQTVRHTVNFIYARTSINMNFYAANKNGKREMLTVASLRRGKSIDRFLRELDQIIQVRNNAA